MLDCVHVQHAIVEGHNHLQEIWRTSDPVQEGEETRATQQVEHLGHVDEREGQGTCLFAALLLQLPEGEHHVNSCPLCLEPTLRLWMQLVSQYLNAVA